ncbi:hypothetical protein [Caballeronia ptereochthonis]|uniref:hypothetical protein n=1 Tax=Caballeronia ptereochthonis TaxID=1777144 RepID=UPI001FC91800|nr:hypothetical protein [Caballeronia ptereochthonis]
MTVEAGRGMTLFLPRTAFYGEVLAPTGGRHFINIVARYGARDWGSLILVREKSRRPFSAIEYGVIDALSRHLGCTLRHGGAGDGLFADGARSGILVPSWDGRVQHQSGFCRFKWTAYPLGDSGCVLHCQHQEPVLLQALRAARTAGLNDRKQIVAARLACGLSYH